MHLKLLVFSLNIWFKLSSCNSRIGTVTIRKAIFQHNKRMGEIEGKEPFIKGWWRKEHPCANMEQSIYYI